MLAFVSRYHRDIGNTPTSPCAEGEIKRSLTADPKTVGSATKYKLYNTSGSGGGRVRPPLLRFRRWQVRPAPPQGPTAAGVGVELAEGNHCGCMAAPHLRPTLQR
ncbi:hypothetical protein BHE74_00031849 [Ensete ventricosum]|nr:hypothetical protein GW17_00018144 [Ensete ventricosum]RWW61113.1 hypothetical protein BHE74_00031849 [Ensete ventricosum]RZR83384.1 hypothetical protein BHM03_00009983 [Ensete ventricosum]